MKRMVKASDAWRRLITIPGVGHLTELAVTAETETDDPERFRRSPDKLAAPLASDVEFIPSRIRWAPLCAEGANVRFPADPTIRWLRRMVRSGA